MSRRHGLGMSTSVAAALLGFALLASATGAGATRHSDGGAFSVAHRVADDPIVGVWQRGDGRQVRVSGAGGVYTGVYVRGSSSCLKSGQAVWRISGGGPSFSGRTYWYDISTCAAKGWGSSTWELTGDTLRHCTTDATIGDTGCVDYQRLVAKDSAPPRVRAYDAGIAAPGAVFVVPYGASDDSGTVKLTLRLLQAGRLVARLDQTLNGANLISVRRSWSASIPAAVKGPLRACVGAEDAAGNRSSGYPLSACGWLSVLVPIGRVSNGCGGASTWATVVKVQNWLGNTHTFKDSNVNPLAKSYTVDFRAACNIHDAGYGGYTVADAINGGTVDFRTWSRTRVDQKFLRDLRTLCDRQIPASAKTARANCKAHGGNLSFGAETLYDFVHEQGWRFFDADPGVDGVQRHGPRASY